MSSRTPIVIAVLSACAACAPVKDYHGYIVDEVQPSSIEPGVDTRSTVIAKLGSPSTTGMFSPSEGVSATISDDPVWAYVSFTQSRFAYLKPKTTERTVTLIRFDATDQVESVEVLGLKDGERIAFNGRETPTRGRELGFLEQIFGTVGRVALPEESDNPTDPRRR